MASEEHEVDEESKEQLAQRIRWHLKEADGCRATDKQAARYHDELADGLIERLCHRVLGSAEGYANRAFGKSFELAEEAVVETFVQLTRALRNYTTRKGLEERFDATFHSIAVDAIRSVRRNNPRISGHPPKGTEILSADQDLAPDESGETYLEAIADDSSLGAFFELIDRTALESIASRMPERWLEVLRLRTEGHDFQDIADTLNINRDTASSDYKKALAFIKTNLTPQDGGDNK